MNVLTLYLTVCFCDVARNDVAIVFKEVTRP